MSGSLQDHDGLAFLSWADFDAAVAELVKRLTPLPEGVGAVYGEARGGLPLAVALSHRLGLPMHVGKRPEAILWVDDIFDSGRTCNRTCDLIRRTGLRAIPVVWLRRAGVEAPEGLIHAAVAPPGVWVVFPWEDPAAAEADRKDSLHRWEGEGGTCLS
jgi:adenine/guanine phosphoribosyltransferase-like PRPP-binding protein